MNRRRFLSGVGAGAAVGVTGCRAGGQAAETRGPPPASGAAESGGAGPPQGSAPAEPPAAAGGATLSPRAPTSHDGDAEPTPWLPSQEYEAAYDLEHGRQYVRQELTEAEGADVSELYVTVDLALIRRRSGDETRYARRAVERSDGDFAEAMRAEVVTGIRVEGQTAEGETEYEGLNLWNPTSDGAGEVRGERTARFAADAFAGERTVPETVDTASATVHVYESGVVPRLEQSWAGEHDGQSASVDVDIDYRDLGATVPEPDWVETAREETSA